MRKLKHIENKHKAIDLKKTGAWTQNGHKMDNMDTKWTLKQARKEKFVK